MGIRHDTNASLRSKRPGQRAAASARAFRPGLMRVDRIGESDMADRAASPAFPGGARSRPLFIRRLLRRMKARSFVAGAVIGAVLAWITTNLDDPRFSNVVVGGYRWYGNEHCMVVYGLSSDGARVLANDPMEGLVAYDASRFAQVYESCGSYAVALIG